MIPPMTPVLNGWTIPLSTSYMFPGFYGGRMYYLRRCRSHWTGDMWLRQCVSAGWPAAVQSPGPTPVNYVIRTTATEEPWPRSSSSWTRGPSTQMSRPGIVLGPPRWEAITLKKSHSNSLLTAIRNIYIWERDQWRMLATVLIYSTLLQLPAALRFYCVGGCWDQIQGRTVATLKLAVETLTTRLDLIHLSSFADPDPGSCAF